LEPVSERLCPFRWLRFAAVTDDAGLVEQFGAAVVAVTVGGRVRRLRDMTAAMEVIAVWSAAGQDVVGGEGDS
jgi:hypothetical protein